MENEEILEMYKEVEVEFESLYKGLWSYSGEHDGKKINVSGGEMSYEAAYGLKLNKKMIVGNRVDDISEWDIEVTDTEVSFSQKDDY